MPVVFEAQGGMASEAVGTIHKIALAVAEVEQEDPAKVKAEFLQQLALVRVRANDVAISRRRAGKPSPMNMVMAQLEAATKFLKEPN